MKRWYSFLIVLTFVSAAGCSKDKLPATKADTIDLHGPIGDPKRNSELIKKYGIKTPLTTEIQKEVVTQNRIVYRARSNDKLWLGVVRESVNNNSFGEMAILLPDSVSTLHNDLTERPIALMEVGPEEIVVISAIYNIDENRNAYEMTVFAFGFHFLREATGQWKSYYEPRGEGTKIKINSGADNFQWDPVMSWADTYALRSTDSVQLVFDGNDRSLLHRFERAVVPVPGKHTLISPSEYVTIGTTGTLNIFKLLVSRNSIPAFYYENEHYPPGSGYIHTVEGYEFGDLLPGFSIFTSIQFTKITATASGDTLTVQMEIWGEYMDRSVPAFVFTEVNKEIKINTQTWQMMD